MRGMIQNKDKRFVGTHVELTVSFIRMRGMIQNKDKRFVGTHVELTVSFILNLGS